MNLNRREFIRLMGLAGAAGLFPRAGFAAGEGDSRIYDVPAFGNARILHFTDCHAQLNPIYFREPNVNLGVGSAYGKAPHLVGAELLKHFGIAGGGIEEHAFTYLNFEEAARTFGKVGGFAHLSTLVKKLRAEYGQGRSLLIDGGDTWQGSGTAYWTRGRDMVEACNLLGVDVMTGHWEFTYLAAEVLDNAGQFKGEFVSQNCKVRETALFDYELADVGDFNEDTGHVFKPYTIREMGDLRIAVVGQSFPYTPIANPQRFIPDWTFGINEEGMQEIVNQARDEENPDGLIVLSHNGMDVDLKMASRVSGIDAIFGGHTHDGMPGATPVSNPGGKTLVTNAGSNGKFLGVMDMDFKGKKLRDFRYRLLPVFSNLLQADTEMSSYIEEVRKPHLAKLQEKLAVAEDLLYRRGNFNGTFDQIICDALRIEGDAQISLSPGFRWGTTVLSGQPITMENVMDQTCITYPETYVREMSGENIKLILEDVADNLFNEDPYYQQGGDMVRLGGLDYSIDPGGEAGQRISDMQLDDGTRIEAAKNYKVAGWATVGSESPGAPVWDVVADYLRREDSARISKLNTPKIKNVTGNPGIA
ncbi:MAG: thiosulfohydrolase SoxB [Gammaproteobacteria bacterium]|nr:thiosulfohydrolase SoxB [Gammaproteobacteria bacterium]MDH3448387.1 thiosulfohydrolase SoxB [Gammaproteobacteria bacterium]